MKKTPEEIAEQMSNFVNNFECEYQEFINHIKGEHRTLQQSFTRLCVKWLEELANTQENWYDLRNEASVKLAKEFVEKVTNRHLPFI